MLVVAVMGKIRTIYSIGMATSCLYTNLNDVYPVNILQVVRYAHKTTGIFKRLVIAVCIKQICKCMLQQFVECLHYPIFLWMIQGTLIMLYLELLYQCIDYAIDEVTPLVSHQYPWAPKPGDNVVKQEPR